MGEALGLPRETAQLHLKTIRAAKQITFKGFGRSAAAMTERDAARLVIAAAGSYFAKDSAVALKRFGGLRPITKRTRLGAMLEECLAKCIAGLPMDLPPEEESHRSPEWQQRFGSRRLAETALQLLDPMPRKEENDALPRYAILRWLNHHGGGEVLVFGPEGQRLERGTEIPDLLDLYSSHPFFQVRIVRRRALIDIAAALKGVQPSYGNLHGSGR
ncbi:MAG: hypothetical protein QHD01_02940 [Bradyrhizobium sp.]|uniref:hypothetical protein n=1 Tax=Bradyrhizobium sp. TaxID=376 RepID=UPI0029BBBA48|nr:hypothetical protein [Bradyrhizobium sp.]MDX3965541.1 hypothetical protein [Bradyrhizobium sp.]